MMISIVATSRTPIPDESLSGYEVLVRSRPQQWRSPDKPCFQRIVNKIFDETFIKRLFTNEF